MRIVPWSWGLGSKSTQCRLIYFLCFSSQAMSHYELVAMMTHIRPLMHGSRSANFCPALIDTKHPLPPFTKLRTERLNMSLLGSSALLSLVVGSLPTISPLQKHSWRFRAPWCQHLCLLFELIPTR